MSENRNDEFEVTMSGKAQNNPKSSKSLSAGFRKVEKLGSNGTTTRVDIPNKTTDTVSADKANEQIREPAQERNSPVLNIAKQIQINCQDERTVIDENHHSEKEKQAEENKAGKATDKVKDNKNNDDFQMNRGKIFVGIVAVVVIIIAIILLWPCEHEWVDATCTTPKTCSKCDAVEGEPLGHSWNKATCTKPSECKLCKETKGKALGHKWKETITHDYVGNTITKIAVCNVCSRNEEKNTEKITTLLNKNKSTFMIPPIEFMNRFKETVKEFPADIRMEWSNKTAYQSAPGISIRLGAGDTIACVNFFANDQLIDAAEKNNESVFNNVLLSLFGEDTQKMGYIIQALTMACDPMYDKDVAESYSLVSAMVEAEEHGKTIIRGDLAYTLVFLNNAIFVDILPHT